MTDLALNDRTSTGRLGDWLGGAARLLLFALPVLFVIGRSAADIALILIGLLFLLESLRTQGWGWLRTPWVTLALGLWLYLILISPLSNDPGAALDRALPFVRFIVFAAALQHWLLIDPAVQRRFLQVLGAVVAFVVLDSLFQFATGFDVFGHPYADLRLTGPFGDNVPGTFLAKTSLPVLGMVLAWGLARGTGGARWLVALLAGVLAVTIALTGERMALLTFCLGLAFAALFTSGMRTFLLAGGLVAVLAIGGGLTLNGDLRARLVDATVADLDGFWGGRYGHIFVRSFRLWQAEPVFGVGLKQFRDRCENPDFRFHGPIEKRCFSHPHNIWLEWLVEAGGIAFLAFLGLIGLWIRELATPFTRWAAPPLAASASAAVLVFLWPLQSTMSFFTNWNAILFWLTLGLALAACRPRGLARAATTVPMDAGPTAAQQPRVGH